ncbi:DNA cytosine methyltransferase, partial [Zobellia laminariae]|uniref:DNA cytosine methyltransferase n=1 Tax=Zobellia laminariae TaxID=248906 RepID=UPI004055AD8E
MSKLKAIELFAGVGGFRLGLEKTGQYEVVWSNQWEPSTKAQHASIVYEERFGKENHCNEDISEVSTEVIPDGDVLVGGFPCQDYSVATTLQNSKGLIGKKGVLWWSIHRILSEKKNPPKYLFLENVDRLLKSPSAQRGRDFAIMLKSLDDLGYAVEWRVINAAEYGMPQRRRRIFFLGYHKSTSLYKALKKSSPSNWVLSEGTIASAFPVQQTTQKPTSFEIK